MKKLLIGLATFSLSLSAMASTIGVSNHPFSMNKHIISTEYNNYMNDGSGMGLSAKYMQRVSDQLNVDAGFGFTDGERASRMFVGADMQLIPDYGRQPRVSLKGFLERESTDGERFNSFGFAPTVSKGFAFWGKEAFPFVSLPMKVSLNESEKIYESSTALALGISGRLNVAGIKNLVGNIETNISLRNSYSALMMGVSVPIE
ncbi:MAG: hypothetical protein HON90_00445 [Halobacteriovoraceae bacterium]|jgi:hypothetical protein|nr:hypothetical protein [Halobacteriovoraceae bacterium]